MYTFRDFYIPERMMSGLARYVNDHVLPGGFLQAVLRNDLTDAVCRADDENLANIPAFVGYLYNEAPGMCWGSPAAVAAWIAQRQQEPDMSSED
jgi:hypothetical protein